MRGSILSVLLCLLGIACSDDNDMTRVTFTGSVKYHSTNLIVSNLPVKLIIIDRDAPFDRSNPTINQVLTLNGQSNDNGQYTFTLNRKDLPVNATYIIRLAIDSLIQINREEGLFSCLAGYGLVRNLTVPREVNDIYVDYPTYFQITFHKVNHLSTDRIQFLFCFEHYQTSADVPDITVTQKLPFYYYKKINLNYQILKESGELINQWLMDVPLTKNDTTRLLVEY
jgi:hypothetical protein